jgi:hypothetical protein
MLRLSIKALIGVNPPRFRYRKPESKDPREMCLESNLELNKILDVEPDHLGPNYIPKVEDVPIFKILKIEESSMEDKRLINRYESNLTRKRLGYAPKGALCTEAQYLQKVYSVRRSFFVKDRILHKIVSPLLKWRAEQLDMLLRGESVHFTPYELQARLGAYMETLRNPLSFLVGDPPDFSGGSASQPSTNSGLGGSSPSNILGERGDHDKSHLLADKSVRDLRNEAISLLKEGKDITDTLIRYNSLGVGSMDIGEELSYIVGFKRSQLDVSSITDTPSLRMDLRNVMNESSRLTLYAIRELLDQGKSWSEAESTILSQLSMIHIDSPPDEAAMVLTEHHRWSTLRCRIRGQVPPALPYGYLP